MTKNPSEDSMIDPSPPGALVCIAIELFLGIFIASSGYPILIALFCATDFSIVKVVLGIILLSHTPWFILPLISWGYHLVKKKGLCYPVFPRIWCCKDGERPWRYVLLKEH